MTDDFLGVRRQLSRDVLQRHEGRKAQQEVPKQQWRRAKLALDLFGDARF